MPFSKGFRVHCDTVALKHDRLSLEPRQVAAKERGVIFDVGHGNGAFSWTVAAPPLGVLEPGSLPARVWVDRLTIA
jgi:predicted amidohydrolase